LARFGRWYIIRTLLYKEWLRHLADRGGIFLAILMVVATLLLSVFRKAGQDYNQCMPKEKRAYVIEKKGGKQPPNPPPQAQTVKEPPKPPPSNGKRPR